MPKSAHKPFYRLQLRAAQRRAAQWLVLQRSFLLRRLIRTDRLIVAPTDLRALDPYVAEEIFQGRFPLAGRVLNTNGQSPFEMELPSLEFAFRLHSFGWLRHVRATKSDAQCANARTIVNAWISLHGRVMKGIAWEPDVLAQRIIAWLSHSPIILRGAELGFYRRFLKNLTFQVRILRRLVAHLPPGEARLRARIALAMASLAMPASPGIIRRSARGLDQEIERQILADGGHISRNPRVLLELLLDMLPLRQTYVNLGHDMPQMLISGIDRMFPALRFFRHHGGELALFNGATTTLANELASVLRYDETGGAPFKALPHMQYQRLNVLKTTVLMDTGMPLTTELSATAHAGCLSFEMSSGKHRFIINSGSPRFAGDHYRQLARTTAAHSCVVINDTSSCQISQVRGLGPVFSSGISYVTVSRLEGEFGIDGVTASHDGYLQAFGLIHERDIQISASGSMVRGRDRCLKADRSEPGPHETAIAVARFHIHPAIRIEKVDANEVLLRAPDGECWSFSSIDCEIAIEDDVFFADPSGIRASQQLELTFALATSPEIQWVLARKNQGSA